TQIKWMPQSNEWTFSRNVDECGRRNIRSSKFGCVQSNLRLRQPFAQSRRHRFSIKQNLLSPSTFFMAPETFYRVWEIHREYSASNDIIDAIRRYGCACVYYNSISWVLTGKIGFGNFYE